jgi:heme-degrading monooxygenase HmoA
MYIILWEFRVPPDRRAAFEAAYGPAGPWPRLFARADGFVSVELLRCTEQAGRYVTVDRWRSRADFDAFKRDHGAEYTALDQELEGIADSETRIGAFDAAGTPAA